MHILPRVGTAQKIDSETEPVNLRGKLRRFFLWYPLTVGYPGTMLWGMKIHPKFDYLLSILSVQFPEAYSEWTRSGRPVVEEETERPPFKSRVVAGWVRSQQIIIDEKDAWIKELEEKLEGERAIHNPEFYCASTAHASVRNAALEEAAKALDPLGSGWFYTTTSAGTTVTFVDVAAKIRGMKKEKS